MEGLDRQVILARDDFSSFPIGEFPFDPDHTAMGEYQYVVEKGDHGIWTDQVCNYTWNGTGPTWLITEQEGKHAMECMRVEKNRPHRMFPTLQCGKTSWTETDVAVTLRRLSLRGMAGLCFCMNHSIDTLVFSLEEGDRVRIAYRHKEDVQVLAEGDFPQDPDTAYRLRVSCAGDTAVCYVNDKQVLSVTSPLVLRGGKCGITADCPTRFTDFLVTTDDQGAQAIRAREEHARALEAEEMQRHAPMQLLYKIDLKNFGTSRQIRFGHLKGDDSWQVVLAQMQRRVSRDAYEFISCLTAIDLSGEVLWQLGEPSDQTERLGKVSADMPLQVYDIDHDGVDEVICGWDFEIRILDGRTGQVKKACRTPRADGDDEGLIGAPYNTYAFSRLNPDGIRICNFRGLKEPSDILIKDRYCRIWALDSELNLLWKYKSPTNTGHCPLPVDIDGDGRDELLVGYRMLDSDGTELWHYPIEEDHTDEIVAGRWKEGDERCYFACVSGTEGFFVGDCHGHILRRDMIGHAQRVSVANYCPDRPGLQIAVTNFWGHQGVILLYDQDGKMIWEMENEMNGNIVAPVNWDGNGTELILTNADPERGGCLNGDGVRALAFPDDGHPTLCVEAMDLDGDGLDELICWDYHRMYIYTQGYKPQEITYHPVKFPRYNASNYRGEYAYPDSSYLTFHEDKEAMRRNR
ncbi:MAG: hypothetical protein IJ083_10815 [Clostridia bacterium]|nr:hypothetical protein [Clostridia bacterium]